MENNYEALLTALADKLGTTVEMLWGVLIKQAFISASANLFMIVTLITVCIVWGLWIRKYMKSKDADDDIYIPNIIAVFILGLILLVVVPFQASSIISGFFNPEYWALKEILRST